MFGVAAPDTDHQLLAGEGQWIFNLDGEKYYLPFSKRHFLLSFFQYVTRPRKMKWQVTRTTDSIHVGKLIAISPGYTKAGPPQCILGLHPGIFLQDIPVGENLAMAQTFANQFFKTMATILQLISRPQARFIPPRPDGRT